MKSAVIALAMIFPQALATADAVERKYKRFLVKQVRYVWGKNHDVSTFAAQIKQESNWNPEASSPFAAGLTQFTPGTAKWISSRYSELDRYGASNDFRYDWKWSIKAMVRYDDFLFKELNRKGVADKDIWHLTLRAYNGGLGWVLKELNACKTLDYDCCKKFRRKSACKENIQYPKVILGRWKNRYAGWDR